MFTPPFCPNPECDCHRYPLTTDWWRPNGRYATRAFGEVPRFKCRRCGSGFSAQTFSLDYYAKFRLPYRELEELLSSSMSVRALGRHFQVTPQSILNRIDRLARQEIACHAKLRPRAALNEDVSIDGLVSFDRSQYFPCDITIAISAESRFVLSFTHATLRRSGTTRPEQKLRRDELYEGLSFEPRAVERSFREIMDSLERERPPCHGRPLVLITDEKTEYSRAFHKHRLFTGQDEERRIARRTISSRAARTWRNPLFASNYIDREIRKDQAGHRRETACHGRNVANGLMRLACYFGWHNYRKKFLIKSEVADERTHGEAARLDRGAIWTARMELFSRRAFRSRSDLCPLDDRLWRKGYRTPLKAGPDYLPAFALR